MKKINSGYIMSVVSAVLLLLEVIGVKVNVPYVNEVVMAVLGVLVALGIVSGTKTSGLNKKNSTSNDAKKEVDVDEVIDNGEEAKLGSDIDNIVDSAKDYIESVIDDISVDVDEDNDDKTKDIV